MMLFSGISRLQRWARGTARIQISLHKRNNFQVRLQSVTFPIMLKVIFYSQKDFTCDHWYNVDCKEATAHYRLNADPETNPYTKDQIKKQREAELYH